MIIRVDDASNTTIISNKASKKSYETVFNTSFHTTEKYSKTKESLSEIAILSKVFFRAIKKLFFLPFEEIKSNIKFIRQEYNREIQLLKQERIKK